MSTSADATPAQIWPWLGIALASVAALLALTFLFMPLWLRAALDLGLWAGMAWMLRPAPLAAVALKTSP